MKALNERSRRMEAAYASMRETINEDLPSMQEAIKDLNERNRRMEATTIERDRQLEERTRRMEDALIHISNALGAQSAEGSGPSTRST